MNKLILAAVVPALVVAACSTLTDQSSQHIGGNTSSLAASRRPPLGPPIGGQFRRITPFQALVHKYSNEDIKDSLQVSSPPLPNQIHPISLMDVRDFALRQPGNPTVVALRESNIGQERAGFVLPGPLSSDSDRWGNTYPVIYVEVSGVEHPTIDREGKTRVWHNYRAILDPKTGFLMAEYWW